jgi:hypothetical protein
MSYIKDEISNGLMGSGKDIVHTTADGELLVHMAIIRCMKTCDRCKFLSGNDLEGLLKELLEKDK